MNGLESPKRRFFGAGVFYSLSLLAALTCAAAAQAFSLFGFPTFIQIQNDQIARWRESSAWFQPNGQPDGPFILSYGIDQNFMQAVTGPNALGVQQNAHQAVLNALQTWTDASHTRLRFQEAPWPAHPNLDSGVPNFEGPSQDVWNADFLLPKEQRLYGLDTLWGWGANIEFFSRPNGWQYQFDGLNLSMHSGTLGFAVVNRRSAGTNIVSAEIYLNESQGVWAIDDNGLLGGFDVETVILHEIGHMIGFDHPDEAAAMSSENLDPFTFEIGASACTCDAMNSAYTGVDRALTTDEIGGIAYLFPPAVGDLDADRRITPVDVSRALAILKNAEQPDPYELRALDFFDRNQQVDVSELTLMFQWATGEVPYDPDQMIFSRGVGQAPVSSITVLASATPYDIGKGGTIQVDLVIDNPDAVPIRSWTLQLVYDDAVFSNPDVVSGDFPIEGLNVANTDTPGIVEFFSIGAVDDTRLTGSLATLTFDINIPAAVTAQAAIFAITTPTVVVNTGGNIHNYTDLAGESLFASDANVIASDLDADNNGIVNLADLYAWHSTPRDVNQDSMIDDVDREALENCLRQGEDADMLTGRAATP